jgi:hypothetical protein
MPYICPWSLDIVEYDSCSHSALYEGVRDKYENLTPEQIAAREHELYERQKEAHRIRNTATYHNLKLNDYE